MSTINILVADDEIEIADLIEIHLVDEGYQVYKAQNGAIALSILRQAKITLAILDIMMPEIDGLKLCSIIREEMKIPIIILSARSSDMDKITGLVTGADDYITKPFNPMELIARVNAQLRRFLDLNVSSETSQDLIEINGLAINKANHEVILYNQPIALTPKEFAILDLLASNPNKIFSIENIFTSVWNDAYLAGDNTVMVHIRHLRKKLGDDARNPKFVKTIWGVGYKFNG